ncbi:hypothetical protein B0H34DRAFT_736568 [Crassisporium funariophilum]|nr:hypothetical protein B0H34DRAFT_736568 [Crassisporium funariophilum]
MPQLQLPHPAPMPLKKRPKPGTRIAKIRAHNRQMRQRGQGPRGEHGEGGVVERDFERAEGGECECVERGLGRVGEEGEGGVGEELGFEVRQPRCAHPDRRAAQPQPGIHSYPPPRHADLEELEPAPDVGVAEPRADDLLVEADAGPVVRGVVVVVRPAQPLERAGEEGREEEVGGEELLVVTDCYFPWVFRVGA